MQKQDTDLPGVVVLTPRRFGDDRGWFSETWNRDTLAGLGIDAEFVQDNQSLSRPKGTLRGLHYQSPPHAQAKLVRVLGGAIFDVAVDARRGSPDYGRWTGVTLDAEGGAQLFIPAGFLHGFVTLTDDTQVAYKCSDFYAPECDGAVRWDSCGIDWPLDGDPVLSGKDAAAPAFADWDSPFAHGGAA